ncbi:MAG: YkvA family protein [Roseateles sp.]|uniref:YkvA family protein n=1 Tax=Roseateles sp. TaxID=1971397 RepID=UPI0040354D88
MNARPPATPLSERLRNWARRLKRDGVTLWFAGRHPSTPWHAKALGAFVVAYALSPIDLIPDFIPVLGYVDDVLLLPGLIWLTIRLIPTSVLAECRAQADAWLRSSGSRPTSRWGTALVVAVWIAAAAGAWYLWAR